MKLIVRIVTVSLLAVVPAGATAFSGSTVVSWPFDASGCSPLTIDVSGLSVADTSDGFHLNGDLAVSGSPTGSVSCTLRWNAFRNIAEPIGASLITSVSQTASIEISSGWSMTYYTMLASRTSPCNASQFDADAVVFSPASGALNLGPGFGDPCAASGSDVLSGFITAPISASGAGSLTIHFGSSAVFAANPENAVPEPATAFLFAGALAVVIVCRVYRKPSTAQIS